MNRHLLLFGRPQIVEVVPRPPLQLTGDLDNHSAGAAYSDYLTIVDAVGKCTAKLVSGTLPKGARVYADNVLGRVYVKWDAAGAGTPVTTVPDGSLELGGEGWAIGSGLAVSSDYAQNGSKGIKFVNYIGTTEAMSAYVEFDDAAQVVGRCQIAQGASGKNVVTGQCFLQWRFGDGSTARAYGSLVNSSSGGPWKESSVTADIPGAATGLAIGVRFYRKYFNHPAYADSFSWSHSYVPGSQTATDYPITIEIKDGLNRTAQWTGTISEGPADGTLVEYLPTAFSQSSIMSSREATTANMRDGISVLSGATTNNSAPGGEWIRADLGSPKEISRIVLGTGTQVGIGGPTVDLGSWMGQFYQIECSNDGTTWTVLTHTYRFDNVIETPATEYSINFSPTTARYWRIHQANIQAIRTRTFKLYGYVGGLTKATPTYTQSTSYAGLIGNASNLNEQPNSLTTGAATANSANEWIMADLGAVQDVKVLVVAGGNLPGWGLVSSYLAGTSVTAEISVDGVTWVSKGMLSYFISDTGVITEVGVDITGSARYVRIKRPAYLATTAMRVYHT